MNLLTGRVVEKTNFKNACFFKLNYYNEDKKIFELKNCVLERGPNVEDYTEILKDIFLGSVLTINQYVLKKDKKEEALISVKSLTCYNKVETEKYSPYPSKFKLDELKDKQIIYKDRGFAFTVKRDLLDRLSKKYTLLEQFRNTFISEGFIHVNIPVIEAYSGGAEADLFETKCNYNKKIYNLRTCFEFPLKGLIIAGFPKVFHIGSAFRNESLDLTHSPEFLFCEAYAMNKDVKYFMNLTERLYREAYYSVNKTYVKEGFDLTQNWPIYHKDYLENLIKEKGFKDLDELLDSKILGPFCHIKGYEHVLAKNAEDRVESYCDYNVELCHYYLEENSCFALSEKSKNAEIAVAPEFLQVLSHGMALTTGWGLGLERLIMSCLNCDSIREVQEYPLY